MADIFNQKILCEKCNKVMEKIEIDREGFIFRAVKCPNCDNVILHPADEMEYSRWKELKRKEYRVKLRLVGNSYAVSIPREIVNFMQDQEKMMDDMVKLAFDRAKRISLVFGE